MSMYFCSERRRIVAKQTALKRRLEAKAKRNAERKHATALLSNESEANDGENEGENRDEHGKCKIKHML